ncbi:MAG: hypothetical protein HC888_01925 [Candidatus Competibacteraceae bacterium]|nr:hypothetical protein [Candidatus Competibacteraceae bacterium]
MSKTKMATQKGKVDGSRDNAKHDFQNFNEYWHYAKHLSVFQRQILYSSLSKVCRKRLEQSCERGAWLDVIKRSEIDAIIDTLNDKHMINLIGIRVKVLQGKSIYVPRKVWEDVSFALADYEPKHKNFAVGGIKFSVCKENEEVVLLLPSNSKED